MSRPSALAAALLCALPLALADAKTKPTITAPTSAKLGSSFRVVARNMKPQRYAVRLYAAKSPNPDWTCVAQLAPQTRKNVTHLSVRVTMPSKLTCFSGFPASREGTMKVVPGRYRIIVSVPTGASTTDAVGNVVFHEIRLH